jgi:predicted acylesterase/phospholipase RssA
MATDNQSNSKDSFAALQQQVKADKCALKFSDARKQLLAVVDRFTDLKQATWIHQQLALCTYKDEELYPETRLQQALEILEAEPLNLRQPGNDNAETLALGGAVYKRLWEFKGHLDYLQQSLEFYRAAFVRNPEADLGYGGVNAAYLLDVLANRAERLAKRSGNDATEGLALRQKAQDLRLQIKQVVDNALKKAPNLSSQYWFIVTIGEVCFGLQDYPAAEVWLIKARDAQPSEWELQTTFQQWVNIARQQGIELPKDDQPLAGWHEAWRTLSELLGEHDTRNALTCYRGKVGLALSGGGFRASFFHLGVMARLAEVDALRSIDVLSTVSGGSIFGAQYYLEVQNLLEKATQMPGRDDYLKIIEKLQQDFVKGVESNIRMRAFANFADNLRMIFDKGYSRSHKLGELYESELYAKVNDGKGQQPRSMPDLLVNPGYGSHGTQTFNPKFHNWRRRAKVPVLLLNTTSLNSGHNWFFTASWMGEPPEQEEIDCNERYRRLYYSQAPQHLQRFRLGHAAAASSCVPGLFEPLVLDNLYPDRTVKLVDGGVHDNQGVQGLLNEGCSLILCSDASGQMGNVPSPADDPAGVLLRTVSVLQDRVREAEFQNMQGRLDSGALQGLMFVHSQKDLDSKPLDWLNCHDAGAEVACEQLTSYGVAKDLQRLIANLRTDLDSFTEVEAYALMASGYLMTEQQLKTLNLQHVKDGNPGTWGGYDIHAPQQRDWTFLKLRELLAETPSNQNCAARADLALQLQVGGGLALKVWKLLPELKKIALLSLLLVTVLLAGLIAVNWDNPLLNVSVGGAVIAVLGLIGALFVPALAWLNPHKEASSIVIKVAIGLAGYCLAKLHLNIFDQKFLARGRLQKLLDLVGK